jgi:tetratricopeptide (TPR) repeat protein
MTKDTADRFPGWTAEAQSLWLAGRMVEAIQAAVATINKDGLNRDRALQLAYYFFNLGDMKAAVQVMNAQLGPTPDDWELHLNMAVCLSRIDEFERSVRHAERTLELRPAQPIAYDVLSSSLFYLGRLDEAAEAGTQALILKDRAARDLPPGWALPKDVAPLGTDVISFSLWGDRPRYLRGALRNLLLAPDLFPGWELRFHVDETVPADFLALVEQLGGRLVRHPPGQSQAQRLARRFAECNQPGVGRFLVRDTDSVFSVREALAVADWVASGACFHVIRDWWSHTDLILAGLWGGMAGVLPDLEAMLEAYVPSTAETRNIDQWFLRDRVWPCIRQSCLIHDRLFTVPGSRPIPGPKPVGNHHIGQCEFTAHGDMQARLLAPWIARHPCLEITTA